MVLVKTYNGRYKKTLFRIAVVAIIDYKICGEPGPGERSRPLLLYDAHGFSHRYPEYTMWRLSPELLSKQKPLVHGLDGAWVCGLGGGAAGGWCAGGVHPSRLSAWVRQGG